MVFYNNFVKKEHLFFMYEIKKKVKNNTHLPKNNKIKIGCFYWGKKSLSLVPTKTFTISHVITIEIFL